MRAPHLYTIPEIKEEITGDRILIWIKSKCYVARPFPHIKISLIERLKLSWLVFTGKLDVLR